MKINTRKTNNTKSIVLISLITVILLLAAGSVAYVYAFNGSLFGWSKNTPPADKSNINLDPPTAQEITDSQNAKKRGDTSTQTPTDKISVDLAYAGKSDDGQSIEINMFTTDVIEGDGTCTATLSKGTSTVSSQSHGFVDARSTICEPITISLDKLSEGEWNLTIEYVSPGKQGSKTGTVVKI